MSGVVFFCFSFFFFKQKTAYEMRISDWSSDVCSSDLFAVLVRSISIICLRGGFRRGRALFIFVFAVGFERRGCGLDLFFLEHRRDDVDALALHLGLVGRARDVDADGEGDLRVQLPLDLEQIGRAWVRARVWQ